ncbi:MAG: DUF47 family protein [Candidatus Daviesbacteria bacterium]|nr:DUF47 family protein [Candidatus Daviesbacteria bacterium]
MLMNLLGIFQSKGDKFYAAFEEASGNNHKAALLLEKLCNNLKAAEKIAQQIQELEQKGDQISHNIYNSINSTFVTPLDREDIIMLTQSLDDVVDLIDTSASTIIVYNVKKITPVVQEFSEIITSSTKLVAAILPKIRHRRSFSEVHKAIIEINRLENKADDLLRKSLTKLFKNPKDPIDVIRWRDIYGRLEHITDKTEDIANVLQNLVTKYA